MENEVSNVVTPEEVVQNETYISLQKMFFEEFKSIIKGKIFIKIEPKAEGDIDVVIISIVNFGVKWENKLRLYSGVANMMLQNREYVKTMVVQEYEHYRKFIISKFFVHEEV